MYVVQLKVKAVLVHGVADESLIDACEASGIIVICGVSRGTLHALSSASGCLLAFYISECTQVALRWKSNFIYLFIWQQFVLSDVLKY